MRKILVLKIMTIKMIYFIFRLRDGHSIPILKKKTTEKTRNHPMEPYFFEQNIFSLSRLNPQPPPPGEDWLSSSFPDTNAYKLGFLRLTSQLFANRKLPKWRVWNRQTGGQFWKCTSRAGAQFSHSAQLLELQPTPSIPSWAGKGPSPVLLSLGDKG